MNQSVHPNCDRQTIRTALIGLAAAGLSISVAGCDTLATNNYFMPSGVDQRSAVAAQVGAAGQAPGSFPRFSQIPRQPTDVRPLSAWRSAVIETLNEKHQTDADLQAHPFTLGGDTTAFAESQRERIPPAEAVPPSADSAKASDDYAGKVRNRATAPPPPR